MREYLVERADSPWSGYTRDAAEEGAGYSIEARALGPELEYPERLAGYALDGKPLLGIDRAARRVYVEEAFLGPVARRDATRLRRGEELPVTVVRDPRLIADPIKLFSFLIDSQLIRCYWHMEAKLRLYALEDTSGQVTGSFDGVHIYYTNQKNQEAFAFKLRLDKATGALSLIGLD